jgi:catabolite repression HPr-like protein
MGMMSMGLSAGEKVTVIADGSDEKAAIENIEKYLSSK